MEETPALGKDEFDAQPDDSDKRSRFQFHDLHDRSLPEREVASKITDSTVFVKDIANAPFL
jgi:hypothetical protein